jgi:protein-disulfide isomerase
MNSKKLTVALLLGIVVIAFLVGMNTFQRRVQNAQAEKVTQQADRLVRFHSPIFGPANAPVTIVEFFDPACETCRAFYPMVKNLMKQYPNDVRLVLRYAPFHQGSDQVVKLLEAAKRQDKYVQVLEAILEAQPAWADHGKPNIELAFKVAEQQGGLDMAKAREHMASAEIDLALKQDIQDLTALEVTKTPTFFVNGKSLPSFGLDQLIRPGGGGSGQGQKTMKNPFGRSHSQTINLQAMPVRRIILLGMATASLAGLMAGCSPEASQLQKHRHHWCRICTRFQAERSQRAEPHAGRFQREDRGRVFWLHTMPRRVPNLHDHHGRGQAPAWF